MFEKAQEKEDQFEQVLKKMDEKTTGYIELSDAALANIVGGATTSSPLRSASVPMFIL
ncbi:MAG: hypothetical protein AAGE59_16290 [Cyanobacteria bacterium P01_F01_bin.86]